MGMISTVALAVLDSAQAFSAPAMRAPARSSAVTMFSEGDIGVLPPLGVYDPLGLIETRDMRRYEIMEVKHGRAAMLGFLHVIALKAGVVLPGALTLSGTKFSDIPTSCFGSLEAVPTFGWLQIMLFCLFQETGYGLGLAKGQTGRAAMLGITGCLVHEILGVDALYPTGGLGGAAPQPSSEPVSSLLRRARAHDATY